MTVMIENEAILHEAERMAAKRGVSVSELITSLVRESALADEIAPRRILDHARFQESVKRAQDSFRQHGSKDMRPHEEIIGYNEQGLFG